MLYPLFTELQEIVAAGYCTRRRHVKLPLWIYNYSQKAQFEYKAHNWPQVLRDARGLILDESGYVIARGFSKFFNLSQLPEVPSGHPEFWEKVDGSLILLCSYKGQRIFSTRGSFESDQALWADSWFSQKAPDYDPPAGETILLEAVYPGNRVVVDYGATEELVALCSVDRSGTDTNTWQSLPAHIRRARFYGVYDSRAIPHKDGEGFVLRWPDGTRARVKLDDYVRLHRLIFGTSTKTIWASLRAGESPEDTTADIPAELRDWIVEQPALLRAQHGGLLAAALVLVEEARRLGLIAGPRKDFAQWVNTNAGIAAGGLQGIFFRLADQREVEDEIWRKIEPDFIQPPWIQRDDGE